MTVPDINTASRDTCRNRLEQRRLQRILRELALIRSQSQPSRIDFRQFDQRILQSPSQPYGGSKSFRDLGQLVQSLTRVTVGIGTRSIHNRPTQTAFARLLHQFIDRMNQIATSVSVANGD